MSEQQTHGHAPEQLSLVWAGVGRVILTCPACPRPWGGARVGPLKAKRLQRLREVLLVGLDASGAGLPRAPPLEKLAVGTVALQA
eukprot:7276646-Pyramimonas_sp.AAC.1